MSSESPPSNESADELVAHFARHGHFLDIAKAAATRAQHLAEEVKARAKKKPFTDDDPVWVAEQNDKIDIQGVIAVVFAALCLESFINDYAIARLSRNYLEKYLDRLNPHSKWVVIPKLVMGEQLDPGGEALQRLDELSRRRNRLVHFKTAKKGLREITGEEWVGWEDAARAVETVQLCVTALAELDPSVDPDWHRG